MLSAGCPERSWILCTASALGASDSLAAPETTETEVRDALARLRTDPDYRKRARSLAAVAARYQAPTRAAEEVSRLV
jgi:UDP:flavonoid glycosyltransferase YjiC (YdhE family)